MSTETRRWWCPECGNEFQIPQAQPDPVLCMKCVSQAAKRKGPPVLPPGVPKPVKVVKVESGEPEAPVETSPPEVGIQETPQAATAVLNAQQKQELLKAWMPIILFLCVVGYFYLSWPSKESARDSVQVELDAAEKRVEAFKEKVRADQDAQKSDLQRIQGRWKRVPTGLNGAGWRYEFRDRKMQEYQKLTDGRYSLGDWCDFALDESQNPKWISVGGNTIGYGIYELSGNRLRICFGAIDPAKRPTEFAKTDVLLLWEFERE